MQLLRKAKIIRSNGSTVDFDLKLLLTVINFKTQFPSCVISHLLSATVNRSAVCAVCKIFY